MLRRECVMCTGTESVNDGGSTVGLALKVATSAE